MLRNLFNLSSSLESRSFESFKEVAVASTILKLLIVAFRSVLDYNTTLSDSADC